MVHFNQNILNEKEAPEEKNALNRISFELKNLKDEISNLNKGGVGKKGSESKEKIDIPEKTYTNTKNNLRYNLYDQDDPRRKNKEYRGSKKTIGQMGGHLTAMACVASSVDSSITPLFVAESCANKPPKYAIPKLTNNKIASEPLQIDNNTTNKIKEHLKKGYPTIITVRGRKGGGENTLAGTQQYLAIIDYRIKNDKEEVFIANTDNNKGGERTPADKALISIKEATLFTPEK